MSTGLRHLILKIIAEYVILWHLCLSKENTVHIVDQLDFSQIHGVRACLSHSKFYQNTCFLFQRIKTSTRSFIKTLVSYSRESRHPIEGIQCVTLNPLGGMVRW